MLNLKSFLIYNAINIFILNILITREMANEVCRTALRVICSAGVLLTSFEHSAMLILILLWKLVFLSIRD